MSKKIIILIVILAIVVAVGYLIYQFQNPKEIGQPTQQPTETQIFTLDYQNCTYLIEGKNVSLVNGYSEEAISDSASKTITRYFGNEVSGDFNNDGFSDSAFLLTQETGGSSTFYYVAVALGSDNKCLGTNAIFLGDRIAPQTINFQDGEIIVNYADRNPDEPMTEIPSFGVSKYFKIVNNQLINIQENQ